MKELLQQAVEASLSAINEAAKVYASIYASPHHITFTVDGLRNLIAALQQQEVPTCLECSDGITAHDPGVCGTCYATKYRDVVPREPVARLRIPTTAQDVRDFICSNFNSMKPAHPVDDSVLLRDVPCDEADVYTLTAHDLLSAFDQWFASFPSTTEKPVSSEMLRQCAASGQMDSAQIHAHEVAGEMGVGVDGVGGTDAA